MFLYGADYNPEQWKKHPNILEEDIQLMKKAGCNIMSVGIFAWSEFEPREGEYDFSFYKMVLDEDEDMNWFLDKLEDITKANEETFGRKTINNFNKKCRKKYY